MFVYLVALNSELHEIMDSYHILRGQKYLLNERVMFTSDTLRKYRMNIPNLKSKIQIAPKSENFEH
jgi:hypothetical protein